MIMRVLSCLRPALFVSILLVLQSCRFHESNRYQGYVDADFLLMGSPLSGVLRSLHVERGQSISSGTLIFELDRISEEAGEDEARNQLEHAEAALENLRKGLRPSEIAALDARLERAGSDLRFAESALKRREALAKTQFISPEDLHKARKDVEQHRKMVRELESDLETARMGARADEISAGEADARRAEAVLARAKWSVAQKSVKAPADAFVFDVLFRPGEFVPAGRPVVSLLPPANLKVRFYIPEAALSQTRVGRGIRIHADGLAETLDGDISYISPQSEYTPPVIFSEQRREKLVYMVEGRFQSRSSIVVRPGQPVDVTFAD